MAERLTKKISKTIQNKYSLGSYLYYDFAEIDDTNKLLNKLGKLEDILERYDIESVEDLDSILKKYFSDTWITVTSKITKNWKRACELACEEINCSDNYGSKTYTMPPEEMPQYFHQQAKKEGENNDTNN